MRKLFEAHLPQYGADLIPAIEKIAPEGEVFRNGQRGLERIEMAEIVGLLADGEVGITALQHDLPPAWTDEPCDQPQERLFPCPVWSCDRERFAAHHGKAQPLEDFTPPSHTCKLICRKPNHPRSLCPETARQGRCSAGSADSFEAWKFTGNNHRFCV